jgi:hypothetical protein
MKTRIRQKEYNNGKIEYICETEVLKEKSLSLIIIGLIPSLFILINGYLFSFNQNGDKYIEPTYFFLFAISTSLFLIGLLIFANRWEGISEIDKSNIFLDLNDAKKFIDHNLTEYYKNKNIKDGEKTKKTTIIKYP